MPINIPNGGKPSILVFATPKKKPVVGPPSMDKAMSGMPEMPEGSDMGKCCDKCGMDNGNQPCCDQCDQCDSCSEDSADGETEDSGSAYPSKMDLIAKLISTISGSEND